MLRFVTATIKYVTDVFSEWKISGSYQNSETYWKWVFANHNVKFARHYEAMEADIPSPWTKYTKDDERRKLKSYFSSSSIVYDRQVQAAVVGMVLGGALGLFTLNYFGVTGGMVVGEALGAASATVGGALGGSLMFMYHMSRFK